jgi:hypothetical protein
MNELVPAAEVTQRSVSPFDGNVAEFKGALVRRGENRKALIDWIREALVEGVDFGKIHTKKKSECTHRGPPDCTPEKEPYHWSKDSLRKPGAEKICGMLGVTPTFPTIKDYERTALEGVPIESIILRCQLLSGAGDVLAEGIGARSVESDYGDLNKALKMACKSAHIDATLRMAGLSEIFTQDIEDMPIDAQKAPQGAPDPVQGEFHENGRNPQKGGYTPGKNEGVPPTRKPATGGGFATAKQISLLKYRCEQKGISYEEFLNVNGLEHFEVIPFARVDALLKWISDAERSP